MSPCSDSQSVVNLPLADTERPDPALDSAPANTHSGQGMGERCVISDRLIEKYLLSRKAQGLHRDTIKNQRCALGTFQASIGNRPLARIGPKHIEQWLESCCDLAPATRRARLSTIRAFLRWCERRGYVKKNAAADVRGPRQPRTLPRALASDACEKAILACPDARARLIMILMFQQGLRCVEISRLELGHIDRQHGTLEITGKGGHQRVLPVMPETLECLDTYLSEHPCSAGPLIRSYRSWERHQALTAQAISKYVSGWMGEAGIKHGPRDGISAHAGRHTCATDMLRAGAHLRDVQAVLGHAHLSTSETYLPRLVKGLESAMAGRSYSTANRRP